MLSTIRNGAMTVAGIGALALGGSAIAGAADNTKASGTSSSGKNASSKRHARPDRQPLSSEVAAKVTAAALGKVPGATVRETEAGGPYGSPHHAHITTSDGTRQVVLVNSDFEATAVQAELARGGRGGRGDHGRHGGGRGETALTGETKQEVEAAVLAKYDGATTIRTETNRDSTAPYESHITTSGGKELEVLVSKDYEVVDAHEQPARP